MEIDEYLLELNFILLNGETAYKDATNAFKITLSSTANTWDIREAVQRKCAQSNVPFEDIRLDKLRVYKASLSPSESNVLLQEINEGRRIANSEWKTSLLGDLDLLSHYFPKQPDKTAIHLLVDCTNAVVVPATVPQATEPRWSIDEKHRDVILQEVGEFLASNFERLRQFDSRRFLLPRYEPNPQHSEYRAISSLNIPSLLGKPSLLMHNLPRNGTGGVVDIQGFTNSLESGHQLGVIVGASGSGKSRTAIEILCRHFGFYFTCATGGTQHAFGSKDMQHMFESIKTRCSDPQKVVENDNYATRFATCVVLTCVYILCYLLKSEIQLSPYEWTMMQLFRSSNDDIFMSVTRMFRPLSAHDAEILLIQYTQKLQEISGQPQFPLVVDEAHQLLKTEHAFSSATEGVHGRRPLYSLLVRYLTSFTPFLVIPCGSGLSLKAAENFAGSHMMETGAEKRIIVVSEHFPSAQSVSEFLSQFKFPFRKIHRCDEQLHQLVGRCRITTTFVERWLEGNFKATSSSIAHFRQQFIDDRGHYSIYHELKSRFNQTRGRNVNDVDMLFVIRRAVAAAKMYGKPFRATDADHLTLFELGVGRLIRSTTDELQAVVGEPLIVDAARCYFEDRGWGVDFSLELIAELSHLPTTRGKLYEEFLPSRLPKLLQHRTAFSPPLPYSEWVEYRPEIAVKMCLGTPEFELSDFLENPTSTYYLPTNQAGPDLVALFSPSRRTNLRYVVFLQAKLTQELDSKDVNRAIGTTNPGKFFTVQSTGDVLEGYQDHYSRAQKALGKFDGFFRVVVAFPLNIQSKGGKPMKSVPFVKIDSTNAGLLFEDSLQKFLRVLVEKDNSDWV